jgi:hypothetical protein
MLNYQESMSIIEDVNTNTSKSTKPMACFLINPLDNKKKAMDKHEKVNR